MAHARAPWASRSPRKIVIDHIKTPKTEARSGHQRTSIIRSRPPAIRRGPQWSGHRLLGLVRELDRRQRRVPPRGPPRAWRPRVPGIDGRRLARGRAARGRARVAPDPAPHDRRPPGRGLRVPRPRARRRVGGGPVDPRGRAQRPLRAARPLRPAPHHRRPPRRPRHLRRPPLAAPGLAPLGRHGRGRPRRLLHPHHRAVLPGRARAARRQAGVGRWSADVLHALARLVGHRRRRGPGRPRRDHGRQGRGLPAHQPGPRAPAHLTAGELPLPARFAPLAQPHLHPPRGHRRVRGTAPGVPRCHRAVARADRGLRRRRGSHRPRPRLGGEAQGARDRLRRGAPLPPPVRLRPLHRAGRTWPTTPCGAPGWRERRRSSCPRPCRAPVLPPSRWSAWRSPTASSSGSGASGSSPSSSARRRRARAVSG